jgi:2-desacetyl-2-hydroxyethyl bacteriochlorophyllide A dehydrogenase
VTEGRRLVFSGPGRAELQPFVVPTPGPRQVLVRTLRTLVSAGTEIKSYVGAKHGTGPGRYPRFPGYCHVGVVDAVGADVEEIAVDDRVATHGGHASHVLVDLSPQPVPPSATLPTEQWPRPTEWLQVLTGAVTDDQATFAVLGSVALHGVRKATLRLDESCVVVGQGLVGQLVGQLARLNGGRPVIGIDLDAARLEQSRTSGIDHQILGTSDEAVGRVLELTRGHGADVCLECTASARAFPAQLRMAAFGGRLVIVGSLVGVVEISLYEEIQLKELTIIGTHQPKAPAFWHPSAPWTQAANRRAVLDLVASGRLRVDHLISHTVPAAEAPALYEQMAAGPRGWLGVIFRWE